jgi:stearoyl-CoA desaturase (delta-9 desaturase)
MQHSWWFIVLFVFVSGHITIACVSIYLHRCQTHQSVKLHPWISIPMRIWLCLTTGMRTKEWVACHRKHHAYVDREGDPHSPVREGLFKILFFGVFYYTRAFKDPNILKEFGYSTPDDWLERKILTPYNTWGIVVLLAIEILAFGWLAGGIIWGLQMTWVPFWGAGVVNGIGHVFGYRNFDTHDSSRNVSPIGIWLLGEELHNNHHANPKAAKFSVKWFEFDMSWLYIKLFLFLGLAKVIGIRKEPLPIAA